MKKTAFFGLFFLILTIFSACIDRKASELLVINVLDKDLHNDCHIKGSVNVPFEEFESYIERLDKNRKIVVYCTNYMCGSSAFAYRMLKEKGFNNIWVYEGGIAEWYQKGFPTEGPATQIYLKVPAPKIENKDEDINKITYEELYDLMKKYDLL